MRQSLNAQTLQARAESQKMVRAVVLFVNFFLIITVLYLLKPASRSLILDSHSSFDLPYIWIGSALAIMLLMPLYHRLLQCHGRATVVGLTLSLCAALLVLCWWALQSPGDITAVMFYILVDLLGVTLVEQAWSLSNSIYETDDAKSWYGFVGTGGLLGGVTGSAISAALIRYTPLQTPDLLLVAAALLLLLLGLTWWMHHRGVYAEARRGLDESPFRSGLMALLQSPYLLLIAAALLLAQLVSPLVEYQFMGIIEHQYGEREARTAALSTFFALLSLVSMVINLILTPLILRLGGVLAGLVVQPLSMLAAALVFAQSPGLWTASALKVSDRGLAYSLTRASRELLYIPISPLVLYEAKAWIDMFGYRIFKVLGAGLILLLTPDSLAASLGFSLNSAIMLSCYLWLALLLVLFREYRRVRRPLTI